MMRNFRPCLFPIFVLTMTLLVTQIGADDIPADHEVEGPVPNKVLKWTETGGHPFIVKETTEKFQSIFTSTTDPPCQQRIQVCKLGLRFRRYDEPLWKVQDGLPADQSKSELFAILRYIVASVEDFDCDARYQCNQPVGNDDDVS